MLSYAALHQYNSLIVIITGPQNITGQHPVDKFLKAFHFGYLLKSLDLNIDFQRAKTNTAKLT